MGPSFRESYLPYTRHIVYPTYISYLTYIPDPRTLCLMQQLKERGIYTVLSEGKEFVAHAIFRDVYVLYTPVDWESLGPYTYESDWAGNFRRDGQSTRWHLNDLAFTNRIARSRSRNGAVPKTALSE